VLSGRIVSALKTVLTVTRFGKRLVLREKSHGAPKGDSQDQDQDSHGRQDWRLLQTLRGTEIPGQLGILLVSGSMIVPDTEGVTGSIPVPPTSSRRSEASSRTPEPGL